MRLLQWDNGEISLTDHPTNDKLPKYAILSHTWLPDNDQEVTFQDLKSRSGKSKPGFQKIRFCGQQAIKDGLQYFWVDTCCINKSDQSEVQMSINSMFRWYQKAEKCYVFLSDVSVAEDATGNISDVDFVPAFRSSRWWTRGWTLQELLAPRSVEFFSCNHKRIGDKLSLEVLINDITKIPIRALREFGILKVDVEQCISWVLKRNTRYEEDLAYSLLGMCGVSLSLIYGEGRKRAFRRLREEAESNERDIVIQELTDRLELRHRLVLCVSKGLQWRDHYPDGRLFWKNADSFGSFEQAYKDIAKELAIPGTENQPNYLILVRDWLNELANGPWLLILDNFDNPDLFFEPQVSPNAPNQPRISEFLPQNIENNHAETFSWIFDPEGQRPWDSFPEWLTSDSSEIYWIQGKAGSGKSTLMKFLVEADETKTYLNLLAPGHMVYSHFIWNSGTPMQRSLKGLLCSLVHQIFDEDGKIMAKVLRKCPHISKAQNTNDWSIESLKSTAAMYCNIFLAMTDLGPYIRMSWRKYGNWNLLDYAIAFEPQLCKTLLEFTPHPQDVKPFLIDFERRLTSRCAGLLEVVNVSQPTPTIELSKAERPWDKKAVAFIHRSAREFLLDNRARLLDLDKTSSSEQQFNILQAHILTEKYGIQQVYTYFDLTMHCISSNKVSLPQEKELELLELNREVYRKNGWNFFFDNLARYGFPQVHSLYENECGRSSAALRNYLLLCCATKITSRTNRTVSELLRKGADPNWYGLLSIIDGTQKLCFPVPILGLFLVAFGDDFSISSSLTEDTERLELFLQLFLKSSAELERRYIFFYELENHRYYREITRPFYVNYIAKEMGFITESNCVDTILSELGKDVPVCFSKPGSKLHYTKAHRKILIVMDCGVPYEATDEDSDAINKLLGWPESLVSLGSREKRKRYPWPDRNQCGTILDMVKGKEVNDVAQWLTDRGYVVLKESDLEDISNKTPIHEMAEIYRNMRLLHCRTFELRDFFQNATPSYAILSHTWEQEELDCHEILNIHGSHEHAKKKTGFRKITNCCKQATEDGFEYVWIDTCCIDKTSSAELSEAINSMYVWYSNAAICYAYLVDVPLPSDPPSSSSLESSSDKEKRYSKFTASRWWTRGWTLQELLAPTSVRFFSQDWKFIGTKDFLSDLISRVTGIDAATLKGRPVGEESIAKRMSWASKRVTTRVEDIAYCLIGIFGVNLPLLYGEGEKAFVRLQEEIMKSSDDQSLFAWQVSANMENVARQSSIKLFTTDAENNTVEHLLTQRQYSSRNQISSQDLGGFLAKSPAAFQYAGSIVPYRNWEISTPYSMTNQGLRIQLEVLYQDAEDYLAILQCHYEDNFLGPLGIYIKPIVSDSGDQFARNLSHRQPVVAIPSHVSRSVLRTIYIRQEVLLPSSRDYDRTNHFLIRMRPTSGYSVIVAYPEEYWDNSQKILRPPEGRGVLLYDSMWGPKTPFAVIIQTNIKSNKSNQGRYCCKVVGDDQRISHHDPSRWGPLLKAMSERYMVEGMAGSDEHTSHAELSDQDTHYRCKATAEISKE
ncbi:hypothetical protein HYFRA_00010791, partial [Hymenoscyphus fraxineus]